MKKQILFLVSFVLIAFSSFGQALPGSAPRGTTCVDGPLNPIAGKSYDYTALGTPTGGNFQFWATKQTNFITTAAGVTTNNSAGRLTTPTDLLATSINYGIPDPAATVSITWSDAVLSTTDPITSPTFVAVQYTAPAAGCADNFRVWSIDPIKAFTVDIRNIEDATTAILGYDALESQCVDVVRGANYVGGTVQYDFGTEIMYFEVIAANFTNSWTPTFNISGLGTGQTAVIEWTVTPPPFAAAVWNPAATTVTTTQPNTNLGISIYVRVTITNTTYEAIAATPITLAVDGVNSVGEWDIENNTTTNPGPLCNPGTLNDQQDIAVQTLNPRPELTPVNPTPFVPTNVTN